jgi:hypothetical protein
MSLESSCPNRLRYVQTVWSLPHVSLQLPTMMIDRLPTDHHYLSVPANSCLFPRYHRAPKIIGQALLSATEKTGQSKLE